jgi:hypothetical protein
VRCNTSCFFASLYKNNAFCSIPTLSCEMASIAYNKGTLNTSVSSHCFPFSRSLPCSLSLPLPLLESCLTCLPQIFGAQLIYLSLPLPLPRLSGTLPVSAMPTPDPNSIHNVFERKHTDTPHAFSSASPRPHPHVLLRTPSSSLSRLNY